MSAIVQRGPYKGHQIRKARKLHRCENARAHEAGNAPNCSAKILPRQHYLETEADPDNAGGFGMHKLCMGCAGREAEATVDYWIARSLDIEDARSLGLAVDVFGRFDLREFLAARLARAHPQGAK